MNCPFCGSGIVPSRGLDGTYQHAANVETCIIGDLAIKDLAAWNRRAHTEALEEAAAAAHEAAGQFMSDSNRYVMHGPSGLVRAMLDAIRSVRDEL